MGAVKFVDEMANTLFAFDGTGSGEDP